MHTTASHHCDPIQWLRPQSYERCHAKILQRAKAGELSRPELESCLSNLVNTVQSRDPADIGAKAAATTQLVELLDASTFLRERIQRVLFVEAEIEEALQETMITLAGSLKKFEHRASVTTWIASIARNKAIDVLRLRRNTTPVDDPETVRRAPFSEAGRLSSELATKADVANAIAGLSPKLREVFELSEIQGLSYEAIASRLDIPRNTVASRLRRARTELKLHVTNK